MASKPSRRVFGLPWKDASREASANSAARGTLIITTDVARGSGAIDELNPDLLPKAETDGIWRISSEFPHLFSEVSGFKLFLALSLKPPVAPRAFA